MSDETIHICGADSRSRPDLPTTPGSVIQSAYTYILRHNGWYPVASRGGPYRPEEMCPSARVLFDAGAK